MKTLCWKFMPTIMGISVPGKAATKTKMDKGFISIRNVIIFMNVRY